MHPIALIMSRHNRLDSRACRKRELRKLRRELRETLEMVARCQRDIREDSTQCAVSILAAGAATLGGYRLVAMFSALWSAAVVFAIVSRVASIRIALHRAAQIGRNITNMQASLLKPQCSCALLARQKLG